MLRIACDSYIAPVRVPRMVSINGPRGPNGRGRTYGVNDVARRNEGKDAEGVSPVTGRGVPAETEEYS